MPKTLFENSFVPDLHLERYPRARDEALQAWDSADELLLEHLSTLDLRGQKILILNDAWGALSIPLREFDIQSYSDSFLSAQALLHNSSGQQSMVSDLTQLHGPFDFAILKIPKNLSFFDDELANLSQWLKPDAQVIAGARLKHLPKTAFQLLEKRIGPVKTSLAQKKSRLIFSTFQNPVSKSSHPSEVKIEGFKFPFLHHSNLFSREKLDIGTRFFLEHLPRGDFKKILDLGCANGIVGIAAQVLYPQAEVVFSDESKMAILSAQANYHRAFAKDAKVVWTHAFSQEKPGDFDLVLCNPPFHQETSLDDAVAEQMFRDARHALVKGGTLRVIGNSHLPYPQKLAQLFSQTKRVASNSKFIIVDAIR